MKITKLIFILFLVFAFFNRCTTEESFIENERKVKFEKTTATLETIESAKEKVVNTKDKNSKDTSNTANKTQDWFNETPIEVTELPYIEQEDVPETMLFIVEFETINGIPLSPAQKYAKRNLYASYLGLISYTVCAFNPEKEIWTLNTQIYNDDSIPPPPCPSCPQFSGPGGTVKDIQVESDPDINKAFPSTTTHPCNE